MLPDKSNMTMLSKYIKFGPEGVKFLNNVKILFI